MAHSKTNHPSPKPRSRSPQKKHRRVSFSTVMKKTTQSMPRSRRLFSRLIHVDSVYYLSDLLGATIARPNAILFGALCSFSFTLVTYLLAKNFGYALSGFETIIAFLAGWILGIVFDGIAFLLRKK